MKPPSPGGVIRVDKPTGPTSHDIVARARRALGVRRIGHTGTLDPFASGLLLLCVGPATRLVTRKSGLKPRERRQLDTDRFDIDEEIIEVPGIVETRSLVTITPI